MSGHSTTAAIRRQAEARPVPIVKHEPRSFAARSVDYEDREHQTSVPYLVEIARHRGEDLELVELDTGSSSALAAVRIRPLPVVGGGVGVVAGGPLVAVRGSTPADRAGWYGHAVRVLVDVYADRGIRLHVRAPFLSSIEGWFGAPETPGVALPDSTLFPAYRSMVLDLRQSVEELRAGLSSQWRRHLRSAERNDLEVVSVGAAEGWQRLRPLFESMHDRKGFDLSLTPDFWSTVLDDPRSADDFDAVIVQRNDVDLAGVILGGSGAVATYVLGGSSSAALEVRAGYLAQFAGVEHARRRGRLYYDLGGVDAVANPGGWQFKNGMRGREIVSPVPFVSGAHGWRGRLAGVAERVVSSRQTGTGREPG